MTSIKHHPTVTLIQHAGGDTMVAAAAKVSTTGDEARSLERIEEEGGISGLIRYLMRHRHGSPFEHGMMTFFIHAPIFVIRELQRHRIASYNEESGRYKQLEPVFWSPDNERPLAKTEGYKPSRPTFTAGTPEQYELIRKHDELYSQIYEAYEEEIAAGIGNEVARRLLPVGTFTSCWVTINPRSLMNVLSLRIHDAEAKAVSFPQREIEEVAQEMEAAFARQWPLTHAAFLKNGRVGP
jgi:thymidylate synthase (FAD)